MAIRTLIFLLFLPFLSAAQPKKIALLIGISAYPENLGWVKLHGKEDAQRMRKTLIKKGFPESDIYMLLDADATIEGIRVAFQRMAERINPGDQIFIFYSGHGQQISDDDQPLEEEDGYDECLIPYDCPFFDLETKEYYGNKHFRDDDLATVLDTIRLKAGPEGHVFVAVDACHSGSATRSNNTVDHMRGTKYPLRLPGAKQINPLVKEQKQELEREHLARQSGMASMVAFFAAAASQDNVEVQDKDTRELFGPFTRSLCMALESSHQQATYTTLFERLEAGIKVYATNITPTTEGNLNSLIMNGRLLSPIMHFPVMSVLSPQYVLIPHGVLFGLYGGARMVFYPPDTWDTSRVAPIAVGKVDAADHTGARVQLEKPEYDESTLLGAWGFVREFVYQGKAIGFRERMEILEGITLSNNFLEFDFMLTPFRCDTNGGIIDSLPNIRPNSDTNAVAVQTGDCFNIRVINRSNRDIYFAILDFMPDSVQIVYQSGHDELIKRNTDWIMKETWHFLPPDGPETFKIIASDKPLPDLGPIIRTRSASGRDNLIQSYAEFAVQNIHVIVHSEK